MDNLATDEILNGYHALVSVRAPSDKTKYPYSQLLVANVKFTQNNIEIIARKIDDQKKASGSSEDAEKMGGAPGLLQVLVYS